MKGRESQRGYTIPFSPSRPGERERDSRSPLVTGERREAILLSFTPPYPMSALRSAKYYPTIPSSGAFRLLYSAVYPFLHLAVGSNLPVHGRHHPHFRERLFGSLPLYYLVDPCRAKVTRLLYTVNYSLSFRDTFTIFFSFSSLRREIRVTLS